MTQSKQELREEQIKDAEEMLFTGPQKMGLAKGLFYGKFTEGWCMPYPKLSADMQARLDAVTPAIADFIENELDPAEIDRGEDIPPHIIKRLGELGILGMTADETDGGLGFNQQAYCKVLEMLGEACSSTTVFVNAHHSIGVRALLLYGTPEQQKKYLPEMMVGDKIGAFALTEPEAGSDAGGVQTTADPTEDGKGYILNGQKWYITNGALAGCLTVMAQAPVEGSDKRKVTAFIVTPDMPGFEIIEGRMGKMGIKGTATCWMKFTDMYVPKENILGEMGRGLQLALTVLNYGRTTFGASCTGASKACLKLVTDHLNTRRQFKQSLGEFEMPQAKVADIAASTYAMEAMTTLIASMIDRGLEDYMLETAMLKVWSTEELWTSVNDTLQLHGGQGFFTDHTRKMLADPTIREPNPVERMFRDARLNQIGEGANEVLLSFVTCVGMKNRGDQMQGIIEGSVGSKVKNAFGFAKSRAQALTAVDVPVKHPALKAYAGYLGKAISRFDRALVSQMIKYKEDVLDAQLVHERLAWVSMEMFAYACSLSRLDSELADANAPANVDLAEFNPAVDYFFQRSQRRQEENLAGLGDNDDDARIKAGRAVLGIS